MTSSLTSVKEARRRDVSVVRSVETAVLRPSTSTFDLRPSTLTFDLDLRSSAFDRVCGSRPQVAENSKTTSQTKSEVNVKMPVLVKTRTRLPVKESTTVTEAGVGWTDI